MFKLARVVATHPESHAVDVVIMDDNRRLGGVQVMSMMAGGDVGSVDLPEPTVTDAKHPFDSGNTGKRDIYALVAFVSRDIPIVIGFLYPQVAQVLFAEKNLRLNRHASDVYNTVDGLGDMELHHPCGTYVRVANAREHRDLSGQDYDAKWKIGNNTGRAVDVHVEIENGGAHKASLTLTKDGNLKVHTTGYAAVRAEGRASISSGEDVQVHAARSVKVLGSNSVQIDGVAGVRINSETGSIVLNSATGSLVV